mgnify:CR=1 FL=1
MPGRIHRLRPVQVVVLGDLIHGRLGLTDELRQNGRAAAPGLDDPLGTGALALLGLFEEVVGDVRTLFD